MVHTWRANYSDTGTKFACWTISCRKCTAPKPSDPSTSGVMAIFASRLLNNKAPMILEGGLQRRDFVSVRDVAQACRLALEKPEAAGQVLNIGTTDKRPCAHTNTSGFVAWNRESRQLFECRIA